MVESPHGTDEHGGDFVRLRKLAHTWIPSQQDVDNAVGNLRSAIAESARLLDDSLLGEDRRTDLLRQALEFHHRHGETSCPVCGEGTLDEEWGRRVLDQLADDQARLTTVRQARNAVGQHARIVRELVARVPALTTPDTLTLSTLARAQAAHTRWAQLPDDNAALPEHVAATYPELAEATAALRAEATAALAELLNIRPRGSLGDTTHTENLARTAATAA
ncbi:hypothetical protein DFQ14_102158 [Halopolyspora algeriensis]|uniref:Uncharacterized protein n=1 Tax=Halopolyspora algeriensis TaxID=1500506 RepID=A0A368VX15_9ACTN|nr:hypothetical protein [Halopolyspora algeriensis]RCW45857.1 hypothetical protein DFQ14_102158 [Halopolyspora algeriensis]TQM55272.1 hypothetical protein FHU43_0032 [Halopolyspora algeriensis]